MALLPIRRHLVVACLFVAAVAVAFVAAANQRDGAEQIGLGTSDSISCTPSVVTFGSPVSCQSSTTDAAQVDWGDGTSGQTTHIINRIGVVPVQLVRDSGIVIAATEVNVEPDLDITCEKGTWKNVYEFASNELAETGWGYVYLDPGTGTKITPADPTYPADPGLTDLELIVVDRVQETGECTATSAAADTFDGSVTFTMGSIWEEHSVPFSQVTPWSNHHWKGTQPGFVDVSVTVDDSTVSERRDIYFSGCT